LKEKREEEKRRKAAKIAAEKERAKRKREAELARQKIAAERKAERDRKAAERLAEKTRKEEERRLEQAAKQHAIMLKKREQERERREKQQERERIEAEKARLRAIREAEEARIREEQERARRKPVKPPIVKLPAEDGIVPTKEFDLKFLQSQRTLLRERRAELVGQARRLTDEANEIVANQEMGDVQFDEEGGEGDTMVVERERDLTLSAQALAQVEAIDAALKRMEIGEYGYSAYSGLPIPRERLKALPWTTELVTERAGGLGSR
jgi:RNA polymerase-binding transcription factor DksA